MSLVAEYRSARSREDVSRLRRVLALRAMAASGRTQRQIAEDLGISQSAVSQQLNAKRALGVDGIPATAEVLLEAAAPLVKELAAQMGFTDVAVFGSVARRDARADSDIDLLVAPQAGATLEDMSRFRDVVERLIGRAVDVVSYGGLKPGIDDDILREAVPL